MLVLAAGCTGPQPEQTPAPEEDCLLGGPVSQPPDNRTAYRFNETHLNEHPRIQELFAGDSGVIKLPCEEGLELIKHLDEEGAEIREGRGPYHHQVYLAYDETVRRVTLHHAA